MGRRFNVIFRRCQATAIVWGWLVIISVMLTGCDAQVNSFDSNAIFAKRFELTEGVEMDRALEDCELLLEELFGTPDEPLWPSFLETPDSQPLVELERLQRAAGPVSSDEEGRHWGLYREHCVVCHGISGDGMGPAAELLDPYPRDFRMGKFKFKSTPIGEKPSRDDLRRTLRSGIVGTGMPAFDLLEEEDLEALVDYVIYLSVRGELERKLLTDAALELDLEDGERVFDTDLRERWPDEFAVQWGQITGHAINIARQWDESRDYVFKVDSSSRPAIGGDSSPAMEISLLTESIANGEKLFRGNVASCAFCHGLNAEGNGQPNNYDDWTRDWTAMAGLNPRNLDELEPMLELGALKPRNIDPRNLRLGVFRGGGRPQDIYLRIVHGIEGTPMPAAPLRPDNPQGMTEREVWDLVNYVLSLELGGNSAEPPPSVVEQDAGAANG